MRKLETYINEKLKVTKGSGVPNLISIIASNNREEFNLQIKNLLEYLKDDSDLPIADLEDIENGHFKKIDSKYKNRNDTFLYVSHLLVSILKKIFDFPNLISLIIIIYTNIIYIAVLIKDITIKIQFELFNFMLKEKKFSIRLVFISKLAK